MSRSGYSEDGDHLELWRGTVNRSLKGRRGQAFLRELVTALDAMPTKRLIAGSLQEVPGEVCAIGSVGERRGMDMSKIDPNDRDQVAKAFNIAPAMVAEIAWMNDEYIEGGTPEKRFQRIRKWAVENLVVA